MQLSGTTAAYPPRNSERLRLTVAKDGAGDPAREIARAAPWAPPRLPCRGVPPATTTGWPVGGGLLLQR